MNIQNNLMGLGASRQMLLKQLQLQTSIRQMSSGSRINTAADDAAGLAISEKMRAQQTGLERAMANAYDGNSMVGTAEGALNEVHSMLNRLTELSTQSANGILNDDQRATIDNEAQNILKEIDRISQATNFNGVKLLDGSLVTENQVSVDGLASSKIADSVYVAKEDMAIYNGSNQADATFKVAGQSFALVNSANFDTLSAQLAGEGITAIAVDAADGAGLSSGDLGAIASAVNTVAGTNFEAMDGGFAMQVGGGINLQVGLTSEANDNITVSVGNMSSQGLGLDGLSLGTQAGASSALEKISTALERVSTARGDLGATQNRLDSTINNLGVTYENITAAESKLRDVDMAKAFMNFTKNNVLQQTSQAMLAHSNMSQQQVLQLLR